MKLYSIEGNRQKLDAGAMFGNAPKALWSRWVEADELNRMELACRALLVADLNGKNVLFETGMEPIWNQSGEPIWDRNQSGTYTTIYKFLHVHQ